MLPRLSTVLLDIWKGEGGRGAAMGCVKGAEMRCGMGAGVSCVIDSCWGVDVCLGAVCD